MMPAKTVFIDTLKMSFKVTFNDGVKRSKAQEIDSFDVLKISKKSS